jgi:hypothetical protein
MVENNPQITQITQKEERRIKRLNTEFTEPTGGHREEAFGADEGSDSLLFFLCNLRNLWVFPTMGWAHQDSNLGPTDYESAALTN